MIRWILATTFAVLLIGQAEENPPPATQPAEDQPTTLPADSSTTLRRPAQAKILEGLLRRDDRPVPVQPRPDAARPDANKGLGPDGQPLLLEGTLLVERPGRLMREEGRAKFVFRLEGDSTAPRSMELLENQLLETLEREAEAGFQDFIISAEVTRYGGANYLLLRKVLRHTRHGNLGP